MSVRRGRGAVSGRRRGRRSARGLRSLLVAGLIVTGSTSAVVALSVPAAAYPASSVTLTGHGYGHGRGMGQWGAFGYAYGGATWQQIVEHYYSGSTPAVAPAQQQGTPTRVAITENDGNDLIVTSDDGFSVSGRSFGPGQYVLMHAVGGGLWQLLSGASCAGPWADFGAPVSSPEATPTRIRSSCRPARRMPPPWRCSCAGSGGTCMYEVCSRAPTTRRVRRGRSTCSPSRTTWPGSCPTNPPPTGGPSVRPVRRGSRGDSRSSRPRRWLSGPT